MSATYTQHRDHAENTQIARMKRISAALHDPRIAWTLYHALGRIVGTAQVEDVRAIACEALMSVEFYAPRLNENELTGTLDVLELYATTQEQI